MSELKPRRARANAFDLARTDRDDVDITPPAAPLGELLPRTADRDRPPTPPAARPAQGDHPRRPRRTEAASSSTTDAKTTDTSTGTLPASALETAALAPPHDTGTPRGVGGRPPQARAATSRITATAARVPIDLYDAAEDLVKGRGKPSWGQLIAWTCHTRQQAVINEVLARTQPATGLVPRGQNKRGTASTQITARFTLDEHSTFDRTRELAQTAADTAQDPRDEPITATLVVIAALQVATTSH